MSSKTATTYTLYPPHERRLGSTPFYEHPKIHFIDYFNLIFFAGGAFLFFKHFVGAFWHRTFGRLSLTTSPLSP